MRHIAVVAISGADVAKYEKNRGAAPETFSDIRTFCLFADRMKLCRSQQSFHFRIIFSSADPVLSANPGVVSYSSEKRQCWFIILLSSV